MLLFAMIIVFLTFLGLGLKFFRWGKNSLRGVRIHQVGTRKTVIICFVQLLISTIQFLFISIPETLLHMTLKRQVEISADIFAPLLQYFPFSCKNLTISYDTTIIMVNKSYQDDVTDTQLANCRELAGWQNSLVRNLSYYKGWLSSHSRKDSLTIFTTEILIKMLATSNFCDDS